jgi:hypothetical protein
MKRGTGDHSSTLGRSSVCGGAKINRGMGVGANGGAHGCYLQGEDRHEVGGQAVTGDGSVGFSGEAVSSFETAPRVRGNGEAELGEEAEASGTSKAGCGARRGGSNRWW